MLSIGVTDLQYFSACRRKWWLEKLWQPPKPNTNYWFGSAEHQGLQTLYETHSEEKAIQALDAWMKESLQKLADESPEIWDMYYSEFDELYGLAHAVFSNYLVYDQSESLLSTYGDVSMVEEKIRIPLFEDSKFGKVYLTGKIDLVLQGPQGVWIVDHKTSSSAVNFAGLEVDEQLTAYSFLYYWKTKEIPRGVVYNVLIKDTPNPPKVLKSGELSKDVSQKTVYQLYLQEMEARGIDPTDSDYSKVLEVLEAKKWGSFFQRESSTRNKIELDLFFQRAVRKARDIVKIMGDPHTNAYPSSSTYSCSYCPFIGPCKSMEDGGDWEAVLRARFNPNNHGK